MKTLNKIIKILVTILTQIYIAALSYFISFMLTSPVLVVAYLITDKLNVIPQYVQQHLVIIVLLAYIPVALGCFIWAVIQEIKLAF